MDTLRRYGEWAGNPRGIREDITRCIEEVSPPPGWISKQCTRKRGHGPAGEYCAQHAKRHAARVDRMEGKG